MGSSREAKRRRRRRKHVSHENTLLFDDAGPLDGVEEAIPDV